MVIENQISFICRKFKNPSEKFLRLLSVFQFYTAFASDSSPSNVRPNICQFHRRNRLAVDVAKPVLPENDLFSVENEESFQIFSRMPENNSF